MKGLAPLLLALSLFLGLGFWVGHHQPAPSAQGIDSTLVRERDSLRATYVADAAQWGAFRDSVARLSPRVLVQVVTRYIRAHDTAWDALETDPDTLLRTLLVQDSGCRLSLDSARSAARIEHTAVSRDSARVVPSAPTWWTDRHLTVSAAARLGLGTIFPGADVDYSVGPLVAGAELTTGSASMRLGWRF